MERITLEHKRQHEHWAQYKSYAYLTICDGPDNDDDDFAPTEPPETGDPQTYSLNPEALSMASGITASRVGRRGDKHPNGRYETRNFWNLRSSLHEGCAPHEHVGNVLDQLSVAWPTFLAAAQRYFATLHVVIQGPCPGIVIEANDVGRLAALRASLDVDAYCVSDQDSAD